MDIATDQGRAQWRSFISYVLVTTGAVIGIGNIFGFPFLLMRYGSLFLLFYLLCEIIIAVPLLFTELIIGRRGKQNPVGSVSILAMENDASMKWRYIGWICFIILLLGLPLYISSVAFPVDAFFQSLQATLSRNEINFPITPLDSFVELELCFIVFLIATLLVTVRGINRGLELLSCIIVPLYFIIFIVLAIIVNSEGAFTGAFADLFSLPTNQSYLTVFYAALLYAFFKLNIGTGTMIVYGSYLPYHVSLVRSTLLILLLDLVISFTSYFIIFPFMASSNLETFTLHSVRELFLPGHDLIATTFFFAALLAAWLPTIAISEAATVIMTERFSLTRRAATLILAVIVIFLGSLVIYSSVEWTGMFSIKPGSIAASLNGLSSVLLTPLNVLLIAIFMGWIVNKRISQTELSFDSFWYQAWLFAVRYIAPLAILLMFVLSIRRTL